MWNVASTLLPFFFCKNVADFGNSVERNFVLSTKSKQIQHVQFVSTLSKGRNFTINSFDIVAGVDGALSYQKFNRSVPVEGR